MERQWIALHAAMARGDAAAIGQAAGPILADRDTSPELLAYAVAADMTGRLLAGRPDEAMATIVKHGPRLGDASYWQPVFRFLVGQTRK
jgi:hypothetical protein